MVKSGQRATPPGSVPVATPAEGSGHLSTIVRLREVVLSNLRLEAGAFGIEARAAVAEIHSAPYPTTMLFGAEGLCAEASPSIRMKRIWVDRNHGVPFLSSSDIISMRPTLNRYVSRKLTKELDKQIIRKWDVLISRSGTIGNVGLAGSTVAGAALSEDAIRLRAPDGETAGFVSAFLRSRYGRLQLLQASYGSVIVHIEPEHLASIVVPNFPAIRRIALGKEMCEATERRDAANELLQQADDLLHAQLQLPSLAARETRTSGPLIRTIRLSALAGRLEGRFHGPVPATAEALVRALPATLSTVGDSRVSREVRAITKFRKRVYVRDGGIPLVNSKQFFQVDPVDMKGLAAGAHLDDLPEIGLAENMIAVTCSGTIGRVQIVPRYMASWTASQDAHRVIASDEMNPGFVYAWLASDIGNALVARHTYGSVIVHIDREQLASITIPLPKPSVQNQIGDLVLRANALRDQAWQMERKVISQIESLIKESPATR